MSVVYVQDDLVAKVKATGKDKGKYVKDAIEEKLERDGVKNAK